MGRNRGGARQIPGTVEGQRAAFATLAYLHGNMAGEGFSSSKNSIGPVEHNM